MYLIGRCTPPPCVECKHFFPFSSQCHARGRLCESLGAPEQVPRICSLPYRRVALCWASEPCLAPAGPKPAIQQIPYQQLRSSTPAKPGYFTQHRTPTARSAGLRPGVGQMAARRRVGDRRSGGCEMVGLNSGTSRRQRSGHSVWASIGVIAAKKPMSRHPMGINKQGHSRGIARGKQGETSPPAFPLLSPCYALAIRTPVQALPMTDESGRQVGGKLTQLRELHR